MSRRIAVPLAAVAVVGAAGGALVLSGCGDTASAGSVAASVAGYIPAASPVYVQVSTDTSGPQWTQLNHLGGYFPGYDKAVAEMQKQLLADGISWDTDLRPLLGEAAALAVTSVPDASAVANGALVDPAAAAGRAAAAAAGTPALAVFQVAEGKSQQVKDLIQSAKGGGVKPAGDYNGAAMYTDPQGSMSVGVTADALIVGSTESVVKKAVDAHAAGGDAALSGVFRFNEVLALLPKDVFAMGYVNIDELGKAAGDALPMAEKLVDGQVTGAAAMSLTAEDNGLRIKGVMVDAPASAKQKAFTPTLTTSAPAGSLAYLGFSDLADTVSTAVASASESATPEVKKQIDQVTGQLPLLLGVTGADLTNLTGGEHAVVVTAPPAAGAPAGLALALKTQDGAAATKTLAQLSKSVPTALSQFGPRSMRKAADRGFTAVDVGGVKGMRLPLGDRGDVVWGVKGDLAAIGNRVGAVASVLGPQGGTLADSAAFKAATQGMPDQVTGVGWLNMPAVMPVMAAEGAFKGAQGAQARERMSHVTGIAAWGTPGDNPTVEVFVGLKP